MASTDTQPPVTEQYIHLHIALDLSVEGERRFAELFDMLPMGFKTHFCKCLLVDAQPAVDTDIELLLAKLIRQRKFHMKPRGRPRLGNKKIARTAPPSRGGAGVDVARQSASNFSREKQAPPVPASKGELADFSGLAGGDGWS